MGYSTPCCFPHHRPILHIHPPTHSPPLYTRSTGSRETTRRGTRCECSHTRGSGGLVASNWRGLVRWRHPSPNMRIAQACANHHAEKDHQVSLTTPSYPHGEWCTHHYNPPHTAGTWSTTPWRTSSTCPGRRCTPNRLAGVLDGALETKVF